MANLDAVKRALAEVVSAVKEADGKALGARGKPHPEPDADDYGGPSDGDADNMPPECQSGQCDHPEHHMEAMYGEDA